MKLIVRDNLGGYLPEDLERDISQLPSWRREQALKYRHFQGQRDCTLSYLLLCQALEDEFGITAKCVLDMPKRDSQYLLRSCPKRRRTCSPRC